MLCGAETFHHGPVTLDRAFSESPTTMKLKKSETAGRLAGSEHRLAAPFSIRTAGGMPATTATRLGAWCLVLALFAGALVSAPANAESLTLEEKNCYVIEVDPPAAEVSVWETVNYRFSLRTAAGCPTGAMASWSYRAVTPHLSIVANPFAEIDAAVTPQDGARVDSSFYVDAEIYDSLSGELLGQRSRLVRLTVVGGVSLPDLRLVSFRPAPTIVADRPFEVTATVRNLGDEPAPSGFSSRFVVDGEIFEIRECPPLARFETCVITFPGWIDAPGSYPYTLCLDSRDEVEELQEADNCHGGSLEVIAAEEPNLSLEAISVSPWRTAVGQPTQVTVVVRNVGGLHSHDSTVTLELPDGPRTQSCPVLAPGFTCSRTFGWTPTLEGTVTLVASVLHHASEVETGDNRRTRGVQVTEATALPDYVVTVGDLTLSPAAPRAGEPFTVTARMRNLGADIVSNEPGIALGLTGPGLPLTDYPCPGTMLQGDICEHSVTLTVASPGAYTLVAIGDVNQEIPEPDENNNSRALHFTVDGPQGGLTCQGLWTLTGTAGTAFSTTAPGSVTDDCDVRFGQNSPWGGCYRTRGDGGLEAVWHKPFGAPCPTSVTVTDPFPPHEIWSFTVSIE